MILYTDEQIAAAEEYLREEGVDLSLDDRYATFSRPQRLRVYTLSETFEVKGASIAFYREKGAQGEEHRAAILVPELDSQLPKGVAQVGATLHVSRLSSHSEVRERADQERDGRPSRLPRREMIRATVCGVKRASRSDDPPGSAVLILAVTYRGVYGENS